MFDFRLHWPFGASNREADLEDVLWRVFLVGRLLGGRVSLRLFLLVWFWFQKGFRGLVPSQPFFLVSDVAVFCCFLRFQKGDTNP